ncbi:MAG: mycothiol synthase [Brachybacterium sp.]|nr:mycothiol synthase [Brachybacterium sp.]
MTGRFGARVGGYSGSLRAALDRKDPRAPMLITDQLTADQSRAVRDLLRRTRDHDGVDALDEPARLQARPDAPAAGTVHICAPAGDDGQDPEGGDTTSAIAGYASILDDGTVQGMVDPLHRRRGVATRIWTAAKEQRMDLAVWAHGALAPATQFLTGHGLVATRTLLTMRRSFRTAGEGTAGGATAGPDVPAGVELTTFDADRDTDDWVRLNAEAFASHPEQGRMTAEDLAARQGEPWFDAEGFHIARENDQMLGFVWTKREVDDSGSPSPEAEIYVVATAPAAQGRGIGAALLVAALDRLQQRGAEDVLLYVEGEATAAIRLYERYGFAISGRDVQFRLQEHA